MANPNAPQGLWPVSTFGQGHMGGRVGRYYVPSTDTTAIYLGGLVKPAGSADANGVMSVTGNLTTGAAVVGVVVGVEMVTRESLLYRAASTERYLYVCDDPNAMFEVQDDAASTPAVTAVGNAADLKSWTSGSTVTGRSSIEISWASITASGDGTEDVLIVGMHQKPNITVGANSKWLVRLNNHFYVDGVAGA